MGNGRRLTFWELISDYKIEIPIMQRDYAQGRNEHKIERIRKDFLENIYTALAKNRALDLDFIYGTLKEDNKVILIDGQQRITTLFLLHWYLSIKDGVYTDDLKEKLMKFSYETRISSREFCRNLVNIGIPEIKKGMVLSNSIIDQPWFFMYWKRDPTIKSMLTMLDAINEKFFYTSGFFKRLKEDRKITFQFLLLKEFGLTDELYIKMNARGKILTDFENFKAKFEQFIDETHKEKLADFQEKVDKEWTDFFWKYKDEEFLIDAPFMRFFYFITEMLYYLKPDKVNKEVKTIELDEENLPVIDFGRIKYIYRKKDNLEFLFNAVDKLIEISDIDNFFENLFSRNNYETGKITLFTDNINLFERCIREEDFGIFEKVILFTILTYLIEYNKKEPDKRLKELIRVVRNLLKEVRYFYKLKIIYRSDLRYENLPMYLNAIKKYFMNFKDIYKDLMKIEKIPGYPKTAIKHEKEKAKIIIKHKDLKETIFKLEDHPLLQGMIYNLKPQKNKKHLKKMADILYKIWKPKNIDNLDNSLIIRSMLTIDDYGIYIGWTGLGGDRYFFGHNERWHVILTYDKYGEEDEPPNILDKYLLKLIKIEGNIKHRLKRLISEWLKKNKMHKDYFYYFVKYPEMPDSEKSLYAWKNSFEIRDMEGFILTGLHINPYVKTVCKLINDKKICKIDDAYTWGIRVSPLLLKNKIKMYCIMDGWEIVFPRQFSEKKKNNLIKDFKLEKLEGKKEHYLLRTLKDKEEELDGYDRIKMAIEFIHTLYS